MAVIPASCHEIRWAAADNGICASAASVVTRGSAGDGPAATAGLAPATETSRARPAPASTGNRRVRRYMAPLLNKRQVDNVMLSVCVAARGPQDVAENACHIPAATTEPDPEPDPHSHA